MRSREEIDKRFRKKLLKDPIRLAKYKKAANLRTQKVATERRKWLSSYKEARGCIICREKDPRCLDFHHRDPRNKCTHVSGMVCYSMKRILKEIEKCDLLCANCHRKLNGPDTD